MKDLYNDIVRIDNRINELVECLNDPLEDFETTLGDYDRHCDWINELNYLRRLRESMLK